MAALPNSPNQPNPFAGRVLRALVFDLDGTIVDSLPDIAASLKAVRAAHRLPMLPLDMVRAAVGFGARELLERTMRAELGAGADMEACYQELLANYRIYCVRAPRVYPGCRTFLELVSGQVLLTILTNKPLEIARLTLEAANLAALFNRVLAPENAGRKPDPRGLLAWLAEKGLRPDQAILVGDSRSDFETGYSAGVFTIGIRGGYYQPGGPDPDRWVDSWDVMRDLWNGR